MSKLEGKRNAIVGLLESGCTEPSGTKVFLSFSREFLRGSILLIGALYHFVGLIFVDPHNHDIICVLTNLVSQLVD